MTHDEQRAAVALAAALVVAVQLLERKGDMNIAHQVLREAYEANAVTVFGTALLPPPLRRVQA